MTGDGVNDAPSIKSADIGVGMGITGTDVTKNVADMVLADDNFATIVGAVGEGRRIYDNIRKAIQFLLASNMSEVLGVFTATLLGFTLLNPVHLLFINLITDCFPALALGLEKEEPDVMERPPRPSDDGIFAGGLGWDIAYQGILITAITLASYIIGHCMEVGYFEMPKGVSDDGMTMAFLTMSMCEIFHSFNMRSQRRSVFSLPSHNKVLWLAMIGSLLLTTVVLEVPFIANAFGFTPVSWTEYGIALGLAVLVIPSGGDRKSLPAGPWPEKETALSLSDHIRRGGFCRPGALSEPYKMPGHRPAFFFLREFARRRNVWYNDLL